MPRALGQEQFRRARPVYTLGLSRDSQRHKDYAHLPGATGGANWGGTASDLKLGYVFVNMQNQGSTGWIEKNPKYDPAHPGKEMAYQRGAGAGSQFEMFSAPAKDANGKVLGNWPCQKPPWKTLAAVNVNTGEIVWQVPLGITEQLPPGKQDTGRPARLPDRSLRPAGSSSSAQPATTVSAPSIRRPARSFGRPNCRTRPAPCR